MGEWESAGSENAVARGSTSARAADTEFLTRSPLRPTKRWKSGGCESNASKPVTKISPGRKTDNLLVRRYHFHEAHVATVHCASQLGDEKHCGSIPQMRQASARSSGRALISFWSCRSKGPIAKPKQIIVYELSLERT